MTIIDVIVYNILKAMLQGLDMPQTKGLSWFFLLLSAAVESPGLYDELLRLQQDRKPTFDFRFSRRHISSAARPL